MNYRYIIWIVYLTLLLPAAFYGMGYLEGRNKWKISHTLPWALVWGMLWPVMFVFLTLLAWYLKGFNSGLEMRSRTEVSKALAATKREAEEWQKKAKDFIK